MPSAFGTQKFKMLDDSVIDIAPYLQEKSLITAYARFVVKRVLRLGHGVFSGQAVVHSGTGFSSPSSNLGLAVKLVLPNQCDGAGLFMFGQKKTMDHWNCRVSRSTMIRQAGTRHPRQTSFFGASHLTVCFYPSMAAHAYAHTFAFPTTRIGWMRSFPP